MSSQVLAGLAWYARHSDLCTSTPTRRCRRLAHSDPADRCRLAGPPRPSPVAANRINGGLSMNPYNMDLIIRPVQAIKPGVVMHPPIVLALKAPVSRSG